MQLFSSLLQLHFDSQKIKFIKFLGCPMAATIAGSTTKRALRRSRYIMVTAAKVVTKLIHSEWLGLPHHERFGFKTL